MFTPRKIVHGKVVFVAFGGVVHICWPVVHLGQSVTDPGLRLD